MTWIAFFEVPSAIATNGYSQWLYMENALETCTHTFVRHDTILASLQALYDDRGGSTNFEVVRRGSGCDLGLANLAIFDKLKQNESQNLPKTCSLDEYVSSVLDEHVLIVVGGRLEHAPIPAPQKHPRIILGTTHLAKIILPHQQSSCWSNYSFQCPFWTVLHH